MTPEEQLLNKSFNEKMKWLSSAFGNASLAILGFSFLGPAISGTPASPNQSFWIFLALGLYLEAYLVLGFLKKES
ncbi:MAG: hypothetical protein JO216_13610 [Hyphomicrobiales bacterium]|nr:hypothetical protein [Hyphomicrobiales bacterium]